MIILCYKLITSFFDLADKIRFDYSKGISEIVLIFSTPVTFNDIYLLKELLKGISKTFHSIGEPNLLSFCHSSWPLCRLYQHAGVEEVSGQRFRLSARTDVICSVIWNTQFSCFGNLS